MTEIVPATIDHYREMYGDNAPNYTIRAKAAIRDGEVYGIGGVYVDNDIRLTFIKFKDHEDRKSIVKLARAVRSMYSTGVFAIRDTSLELSENFLSHWGFRPHHGDIWVC